MSAYRKVKAAVPVLTEPQPDLERVWTVLLECGHTVRLRGSKQPRKGRDVVVCPTCTRR